MGVMKSTQWESVRDEVRGVGRNCNTKPLLHDASIQAKKCEFCLVGRKIWKEFDKRLGNCI